VRESTNRNNPEKAVLSQNSYREGCHCLGAERDGYRRLRTALAEEDRAGLVKKGREEVPSRKQGESLHVRGVEGG